MNEVSDPNHGARAALFAAKIRGELFDLPDHEFKLLYRGREPLARGDITIAAMVGAGAGACTVNALVIGVLCSGIFAVGVLIAKRKSNVFMPYGPGLCLGGLITLFRC